jgi:phospholipase C
MTPCWSAIVISNLAEPGVVHHGPVEHTSTLRLIESTFGVRPLTARDANAQNLRQALRGHRGRPVRQGAIPTSSQVLGPVDGAAATWGAGSVASVSPPPLRRVHHPGEHDPGDFVRSGAPADGLTGAGLVAFGRTYRDRLPGA